MITDKLLAFADNEAFTITSGAATSNEIDLGKGGDEIARTMNLVAQMDAFAASGDTGTDTIAVKLQGYDGSNWVDVVAFPAVAVSDAKAGKRLVEFAKLPLGMAKFSKLRLAIAVADADGDASTLASGWKMSAWLTPSAELEYEKH